MNTMLGQNQTWRGQRGTADRQKHREEEIRDIRYAIIIAIITSV